MILVSCFLGVWSQTLFSYSVNILLIFMENWFQVFTLWVLWPGKEEQTRESEISSSVEELDSVKEIDVQQEEHTLLTRIISKWFICSSVIYKKTELWTDFTTFKKKVLQYTVVSFQEYFG